MASITKTIDLGADADAAWALVSDASRVGELITFLGPVTVDGETRVCVLGDDTLEELILDVDHDARRFAYAITRSPFGLGHHSASMQVVSSADGAQLVWTTDFAPDSARPALEEALGAASGSIASALG